MFSIHCIVFHSVGAQVSASERICVSFEIPFYTKGRMYRKIVYMIFIKGCSIELKIRFAVCSGKPGSTRGLGVYRLSSCSGLIPRKVIDTLRTSPADCVLLPTSTQLYQKIKEDT